MTAYCLEQNDDYYQLWRKYVDYFDPGNPPDIKKVLRRSGNTACIPSKEAQDIIKEGKSIIPYLITYTDKKSYFLKIKSNPINRIHLWMDTT